MNKSQQAARRHNHIRASGVLGYVPALPEREPKGKIKAVKKVKK